MNGNPKKVQVSWLVLEKTLHLACSVVPNTLGPSEGGLWRKPAGFPSQERSWAVMSWAAPCPFMLTP